MQIRFKIKLPIQIKDVRFAHIFTQSFLEEDMMKNNRGEGISLLKGK